MKPRLFFRSNHPLGIFLTAIGLLTILVGAAPPMGGASCIDLSDIPLDTLTQRAPGIVMFVLDDSGSMDWNFMCPPPEANGVFHSQFYLYPNPGNHVYTSGSYTAILENHVTRRMMWMSQWAGYNGLYYDPINDYTPWPGRPEADVDNPRANPMNSAHTLDMTAMWHEWGADDGVIVDNSDASGFVASAGWGTSTAGGQYNNYLFSNGDQPTASATWRAENLDPSTTYNVYARWYGGGTNRLTNVLYQTYDDATYVAFAEVNQRTNHNEWMLIAADVTFSSGIGVVTLPDQDGGSSKLCADAVKFVPAVNPISDIARRHYYVRGTDDAVYLVNLVNGGFEYYRVNLADPADNREVVTATKLARLTPADAAAAGIVTGRTYAQELQNFANWVSFYSKRDLTAKNAIANVISTMNGVFIGIISINTNITQRSLPVRVNIDGVLHDQSADLLNVLYNLTITAQGTPLRRGLQRAGQYVQGNYLKPGTFEDYTRSESYPFFKADRGGTCQQAFTILMTDGYYNGTDPSGIGNADGDKNTAFDSLGVPPFGDTQSITLADVAMHYYENDLNTSLSNDVPVTVWSQADHQHMITYALSFGVEGSLDTELYKDCGRPGGTCPADWPSTATDSGKIDDLFHAAVNGRGKYVSAMSTTELNEALMDLRQDIETRIGSGAALATNSIQRREGSVIYQGIYNTANWFGEVQALPLNVTTGAVGDPIWRASDHVPAWNLRNILSYAGSAGVVFDQGNLTDDQISQLESGGLGSATDIVDFIRGDTSKDLAHGGAFRTRTHPLGDVVHSSPTYHKSSGHINGVVYIGANDGMLHAFDAATGVELFAYIPNQVYGHLAELADPGYVHRFYVDSTPEVIKVTAGQHVLVNGLGKGGKGYFALDVTSPAAMSASDVLWEYSAAGDDDLGYAYSRAFIVNTLAEGRVVVFSNGYDSVNGSAVLYVLNVQTGALIKKFDTGVAGCNGLATPTLVDVDMDGKVDYAFAGDLKGNMWKFDLRGSSVTDWQSYYQDGETPMPLVTVRNVAGEVQPVTAAPEVMLDCARNVEGRGLMVIFGTGQYLNVDDFDDTTEQSFYGIWDWGGLWEAKEDYSVAKTKYLGTFNTDRSLSNVPATGVTLLEQTFISNAMDWSILTDHQPSWYNPIDDTGIHMGWHFNLPDNGERGIREPMLRMGTAVLVSTIPSISPCDAGGSSVLYQVKACSGGRTDTSQFDVNADGSVTYHDTIMIDGMAYLPSGMKFDRILFEPIEITDKLYLSDSEGEINALDVPPNRPGMFFWRVVGQ